MSIYALPTEIDGDLVTLVPAADSYEELNRWWTRNEKLPNARITDGGIEHLMEDELNGFNEPVCIFIHKTEKERDEFIINQSLVPLGSYVVRDKQKDMIYDRDYETNLAAEKADQRTIAEVTDTVVVDQWDKQVSENNLSVMAGAPKGVTGDTSLGEGNLKQTKEAANREKEKRIFDGKISANSFNNIVNKVVNRKMSPEDVLDILADMQTQGKVDDDVAELVKVKVRNLMGDKTVELDSKLEKELREELVHINDAANPVEDEDVKIGIIGKHTDSDGNINITAQVATANDKRRWEKQQAEIDAKEEEKKQEIREAAAAVGLDADDPNCHTAMKTDGTVIQQNNATNVVTTVLPEGETLKVDMKTGTELSETEVRKRELQAELEKLNKEEPETESSETSETSEPVKVTVSKEDAMTMLGVDKNALRKRLKRGENGGTCRAVPNPDGGEDLVEIDDATGLTIPEEAPDLMAPQGKLKGNHQIDGSDETEEDDEDVQIGNINRTTPVKEKPKYDPQDFYFAFLPPGFLGTDPNSPILGQETFVVTMPKAEFDAGVLPQDYADQFSEEDLDKFGWEEAENEQEEVLNSVYLLEMNVGDAARVMTHNGAQENGKLLIAMGLDVNTVPFDWPYHYKSTGQRKTRNEIQMEAVEILEAAREQGLILTNAAGESLTKPTSGISPEDIAAAQPDITAALKKMTGAEGTTDEMVTEIFEQAIATAKEVVNQSSLTVDSLEVPQAYKDLMNEFSYKDETDVQVSENVDWDYEEVSENAETGKLPVGVTLQEYLDQHTTPKHIEFIVYTDDPEEYMWDGGIAFSCVPLGEDVKDFGVCSRFDWLVNESTTFNDMPFDIENLAESIETAKADIKTIKAYFEGKGYRVELDSIET